MLAFKKMGCFSVDCFLSKDKFFKKKSGAAVSSSTAYHLVPFIFWSSRLKQISIGGTRRLFSFFSSVSPSHDSFFSMEESRSLPWRERQRQRQRERERERERRGSSNSSHSSSSTQGSWPACQRPQKTLWLNIYFRKNVLWQGLTRAQVLPAHPHAYAVCGIRRHAYAACAPRAKASYTDEQ